MSDSDMSWETDSENDMEETELDTSSLKPIKLNTWVHSAKFHPTEKLVVTGDLDGYIKAWSFDNESEVQSTELKLSGQAHDDSIRAINFSKSGKWLFSIGNDKQLLVSDVMSGKAVLSITSAFEDSPYCIDSCNDNVIATGDEGGVVRLFDIRKKNPVDELLIDDGRCEDTINDIHIGSDGKILVAASADGTLCGYNCKRKMFMHESESMGADLCSIATVKNESKAVVTSADGNLFIYNWGEFGHPSDIFPGHDKGDLVCCKLNERIVLTGDFRGNIRPVNIHPNRIMGILGVHKKNVPIECLDVFNEEIVLSVGTGTNEIRFWNCKSIQSIFEGSRQARTTTKKANKDTKMGADTKSRFYSGFTNDFSKNIELDEKFHSSDDEDDDMLPEESNNKGNSSGKYDKGSSEEEPKSSDSLSNSDLPPPESSTSELDSGDKIIIRELSSSKISKEDTIVQKQSRKRKGPKRKNKKKKVFKPLT